MKFDFSYWHSKLLQTCNKSVIDLVIVIRPHCTCIFFNNQVYRWYKSKAFTSSKVLRYRGFSVCALLTTFAFCSVDKAFPRTFSVACLKITRSKVGNVRCSPQDHFYWLFYCKVLSKTRYLCLIYTFKQYFLVLGNVVISKDNFDVGD